MNGYYCEILDCAKLLVLANTILTGSGAASIYLLNIFTLPFRRYGVVSDI